jgi:hypothetical protein
MRCPGFLTALFYYLRRIFTFAIQLESNKLKEDGKRAKRTYLTKRELLGVVSGFGDQGGVGRKFRRARLHGHKALRVRYLGKDAAYPG